MVEKKNTMVASTTCCAAALKGVSHHDARVQQKASDDDDDQHILVWLLKNVMGTGRASACARSGSCLAMRWVEMVRCSVGMKKQ